MELFCPYSVETLGNENDFVVVERSGAFHEKILSRMPSERVSKTYPCVSNPRHFLMRLLRNSTLHIVVQTL